MSFQKTTGGETILKRYQLSDGEWLLSRHWTEQTCGATRTWHVRLSCRKKQRINMDVANERAAPCAAFPLFDLQIKSASVYTDEIRIAQSDLLPISGSNFGSWICLPVEPRQVTFPSAILTHDRDLPNSHYCRHPASRRRAFQRLGTRGSKTDATHGERTNIIEA